MKQRYLTIITAALLLAWAVPALAAPAKKAKETRSPMRIEVTSPDGNAVAWSKVSSSKNRVEYTAGADGVVEASLFTGDVIKVKAPGYEPQTVSISSIGDGVVRVTLVKCNPYEDYEHEINTVEGGKISQLRSVGAFSEVSGEDLEMYPSTSILDGLSGRLAGLFYQKGSTEPGNNTWTGFVRTKSGGTPVIMIDGVVRSLDYIEPETIESVQLLKDASLKALYGGVYTNGILMITTKRGKPFENGVRVNVSSGVELPTAKLNYLNSADYATAYNKALANCGLPAVYDPSLYDGSDPYMYPDNDYHKMLLRDYMNITRANAQFTGGSKNTRYFLNVGFQNESGLEKETTHPNNDRTITVRGNVDNTIFDFITLKVGINAALQNKSWPNASSSSFMGQLSSLRPNEFAVKIPGFFVNSDEEYVLGGSATHQVNPLGMITRNGFNDREYSFMQTDFSAVMDFNKWIKGLTITPSFTLDIYNYFTSKKAGGYSVFEPTGYTDDTHMWMTGNTWGYDEVVTSLSEGTHNNQRNWHFRTNVNYDRTFGKHQVSVLLTHFMQQLTFSDQIYSVRRINTGAHVNYAYAGKYIVDVTANYVGVPSFSKEHRFGLFPTVGLGWVISNEDFLKDSKSVDYLKLRASYGILGSTPYNSNGLVSNYYYLSRYNIGGSLAQFTSFQNTITIAQVGNPDITFQKAHELNVGVDFGFLGNSLTGSVNAFKTSLTGLIANSSDTTPGITGKGASLMYENIKAQEQHGVEAELYYTKRFGDFELGLGGNVTYGVARTSKELDVPYPDDLAGLRKSLGMGDVKGYQVIGKFSDEADIAASPVQAFGGKAYPGDFKYKDVNDDGFITDADRTIIANTTPKVQYGLNVSLKWKGINLDVLGYGLAGFDTMLSNKYYQIYGDRKYSNVINTGLPNGNPHPVLRAESTNNNFVNSDYWVANGGFFKIRNVELGYTLPGKWTAKSGVNTIKFFARGSNLLTISQIKDLDPENLDAGLTDYPLFMAITGGISFKF